MRADVQRVAAVLSAQQLTRVTFAYGYVLARERVLKVLGQSFFKRIAGVGRAHVNGVSFP